MEIKFINGKKFDEEVIIKAIESIKENKSSIMKQKAIISLNNQFTIGNTIYSGIVSKLEISDAEDLYDVLESSYFELTGVVSTSKSENENNVFYEGERTTIKKILISFDLIGKVSCINI